MQDHLMQTSEFSSEEIHYQTGQMVFMACPRSVRYGKEKPRIWVSGLHSSVFPLYHVTFGIIVLNLNYRYYLNDYKS